MKKALTITLNQTLFYIEEDAYEKLKHYLDSIKQLFNSSSDRDEIIADIESRIAERFSTVTGKAKGAVTLTDVDSLISSMGTAQDLRGTEPGEKTSSAEATKPGIKKFYRDTENRIIAGVASGIAAYFGIDPIFIRIAFVLSLFVGGLGILLYLILWLVTPAAQTLSQKMEMQGDPVTLKNIEEAVKERLKKDSGTTVATGKIAGFFRAIFSALGTVLRALGPIARIVFGSIFSLIGSVGFVAITIATLGFIVSGGGPYMHPEVARFILLIQEPYLGPIMGALFILGAVPMLALLLLGVSLIKNRSMISAPTAGVLITLWMAAVIGTGVAASYLLPRFDSQIPEIQFYSDHNRRYDNRYEFNHY